MIQWSNDPSIDHVDQWSDESLSRVDLIDHWSENPDPASPKGTHPKYLGLERVVKKLKTSYCKTRIFAMNIKVTFPLIPTHNFRKKFLSHKLRCYTEISGPEKSRNNTSEKLRCFFTCVDIANQLLTRLSPLAPLGQFDEWSAKCSRFSI